MNPQDLLALLGRHDTDPSVEAALNYYSIRNRPQVGIDEEHEDGPVLETQSWVKNSRAGIEFGFQDEASWMGLDGTEFGKHPMVLTEIYFYGKHVGVRPYNDDLPFGLELSDDRATVRKKLFEFEPTRHSYIRDSWDTPEFRINVAYADDDSCIRFALCKLREPPLAPLAYALPPIPSLESIVTLLGSPLDDPALHLTFDPLGLRGRMDEIRDSGEADFRRPYGVALEFEPIDGAGHPSANPIVFVTATFFADREEGARRWPGDLPHAIRFGDSPETVVERFGRLPDIQNDDEDDFSAIASWREPKYTVTVFFDTMENRVLRVSIVRRALLRP